MPLLTDAHFVFARACNYCWSLSLSPPFPPRSKLEHRLNIADLKLAVEGVDAVLDANGDGSISLTEIVNAMDKNMDGQVTLKEFQDVRMRALNFSLIIYGCLLRHVRAVLQRASTVWCFVALLVGLSSLGA